MKVAFDALERAYGLIENKANEAALRVLRSGKYILREKGDPQTALETVIKSKQSLDGRGST